MTQPVPQQIWPRVTRGSLMVCKRNWLAWRRFMPASILANLTQPLLSLLALGLGLGLFVREIGGVPFVQFLGPGLLAGAAMMWVTFDVSFGVYDRLHWTRSYHAMISSPLSAAEIAAGEILWQAGRTTFFAAGFFVILLALGIVQSWSSVAMVAVITLTAIMFAAPAILVAAVARTAEQLSYYFNLVIQPMFFFSGIFFPLEALGETAQQVAYLVPLYHAVTLTRALALGVNDPTLLPHLFWLLGFTVISLLLPVHFLRKALERTP